MLAHSSDRESRSGRPGLKDPNREGSVDDQIEKVLVCSESLSERRKLLGYFSQLGAPVILCSKPEKAADKLADDIGLLVVNAFDCAWSVGRWIDFVARHPENIPVIFIHQTSSARDWLPDDSKVETSGEVSLVHVTESGFRTLCDDGILGIRDRIVAWYGDT